MGRICQECDRIERMIGGDVLDHTHVHARISRGGAHVKELDHIIDVKCITNPGNGGEGVRVAVGQGDRPLGNFCIKFVE